MTTINALNAVGNLQKYENTSATSAPSFSGAAERYSVDDQRSKSSDYLKIGLAMAAAAGVGFMLRKPKAAKAAAEAVSDVANAAGRAAGKAAGKAADDLTSVYKLLAGVKIKVAKGQKLIKNGNFVLIKDKKTNKVLQAITLNTNGDAISKIASFEYDKAGKIVGKMVEDATDKGKVVQMKIFEYNEAGQLVKKLVNSENGELNDLFLSQLTEGVKQNALEQLVREGVKKTSVVKKVDKFIKSNPTVAKNIEKHKISKEVVQRILTEKGVTKANVETILNALYKKA